MPVKPLSQELMLETDKLSPEMDPLVQRTDLFLEVFTRPKVVPLGIESPQKPICARRIFEPQHRFYPSFYPSMILLNFIVYELIITMFN